MKDFFDLLWLSDHQSFDRGQLRAAILATFNRRGTDLPEGAPLALTSEFGKNATKIIQWNAFLRKRKLEAPGFPEVITRVSSFLLPLIQSHGNPSGINWIPGTGWTENQSS